MTKLLVKTALVLGVFLFAFSANAQNYIDNIDAQFTGGVDENRDPAGEYSGSGPIYLWTKVTVNQSGFDQLKAGKLSVFHRWYKVSGPDAEPANADQPLDNVELQLGNESVVGALEGEVKTGGTYDWRTWSGKQNIVAGHWLVRIVYEDGTPVQVGGAPAEYRIEVTGGGAPATEE